MSARIIFREYGSPKVLELVDVEVAEPGPGQVRVRNEAIGVNPFDWKVVAGFAKDWFKVEFPGIPGSASAGVVDAVGEDVTEFAVGDPVIVSANGAYQEYIVTKANHVVARPSSVDADQGAALPTAATTGYALVEQVGVGPDDVLLVHGGSGPVGATAVQIAVARGAKVIATASPANHDYLRSIGAIPVAYGGGLEEAVRALGTVTAVIATAPGEEVANVTKALLADISRSATSEGDNFTHAVGIADVQHPKGALQAVAKLAGEGVIKVRISRVLPLADAAEAFEISYKGHANGKLILHP